MKKTELSHSLKVYFKLWDSSVIKLMLNINNVLILKVIFTILKKN